MGHAGCISSTVGPFSRWEMTLTLNAWSDCGWPGQDVQPAAAAPPKGFRLATSHSAQDGSTCF